MTAFDKLRAYFTAHPDVTQSAFAAKVGAWQSQVHGWLDERGTPGIQHLSKVNRLIGSTSAEWIKAKKARRERAA